MRQNIFLKQNHIIQTSHGVALTHMIQSPIILQRYAHDPISHQIEMSFSFLLFFIFFLLTGGAELFLNFTTEMAVSDRLILGFLSYTDYQATRFLRSCPMIWSLKQQKQIALLYLTLQRKQMFSAMATNSDQHSDLNFVMPR